jgi:DNA polymerase III alpha subunit
MKTNKFGEIILDQWDLCDVIMQGRDASAMTDVTVDTTVDIQQLIQHVDDPSALLTWAQEQMSDISVEEFDRQRQSQWFMPAEYRDTDIAQHVLSLCETQEQLQRAGQELLMFQERDLFDLLRYLRYLVDVMRQNHIIWGVGRGSSVASYVLYLLGVHRIDSMFYDLDPAEFLR